jgi:hypothetical protein
VLIVLSPNISTEAHAVASLGAMLVLTGAVFSALAQVFVREWLESPGHRVNLLNRDMTLLGCAARLARVPVGPPRVFAVQVFAPTEVRSPVGVARNGGCRSGDGVGARTKRRAGPFPRTFEAESSVQRIHEICRICWD